ncbi:MAG: sigma-70 family RNA polymerase sigma factor [Clostridiales bacterium]|nr:sigma-70 family RNA polymerase sigma factor [Clostridiales bacterium]
MLILAMLAELDAKERDLVLELWERYGEMMYAVALDVLGNREDAEDAVGETVERIMSHLEKFKDRDDDSVKNQIVIYIRAIARNTAIDAYRRRKRVSGHEILMPEDAPDPEDDAPLPEEILMTRELRETVQNALALLPQMTKDAVTLFYLEDYSYDEIAEILGIPVSQVKGRLFRARKKLRELLGGVRG